MDQRKALVGHNIIFDIGYIFEHFIAPLPDTYKEYVEKLHYYNFNNLYDTKQMCLYI